MLGVAESLSGLSLKDSDVYCGYIIRRYDDAEADVDYLRGVFLSVLGSEEKIKEAKFHYFVSMTMIAYSIKITEEQAEAISKKSGKVTIHKNEDFEIGSSQCTSP